ncbi:hypothetical protein ACN469_35785 [Corallococcus terminator]
MARDCLQPWMDRLAHAQLETEAFEPHASFGWESWDDQRLGARMLATLPSNPDSRVLPAELSRQVVEDPGWEPDDSDFSVASY